ncbi:MAG: helix-turn-helix domain-containing protein [Kiloniellales bacterium]|nr:helix-turn-helix domain-containing protein [Kiloniellales bacterium]
MEADEALHRIDHHSDHGSWTLLRRRPPPQLERYVREIQGYAEDGGAPVLRTEVPSGVLPMILVFGHGFTLHNIASPERARPLDRSFLAGLHEVPSLVGSAGRALCMQVDFTPIGAWRFLRMDLQDLAGQVVDLEPLLGPLAAQLEARLEAAADWPERFALLVKVLSERILPAPNEAPLVEAAHRTIEASGGRIPIGALAAGLGCSRKHLATVFRRHIGVAPKSFARVLRFECALRTLRAGRAPSLAALAADCGYADQAHFNRDFRAFAGESPRALLARCLTDGTGILADRRWAGSVTEVQDRPPRQRASSRR